MMEEVVAASHITRQVAIRRWKGEAMSWLKTLIGRVAYRRDRLSLVLMVVAPTARRLAASDDEDDRLRSRQIWNHSLAVDLFNGLDLPIGTLICRI
ncbi:hypothetical protein ACLOJK_034424 [Asimina triloba]